MTYRRVVLNAVFALAMLYATNAQAQSNFKLKEVVRTGDAAPVPAQIANISQFALNSQGQVAFFADGGLFLESGGVTSIVAAFGDPAPGGGTFRRAGAPSMNSQGQIVFRGSVLAPGTSGLFLASGGSITQLLADGSLASSGDVVFPAAPVINDSGAVAFVSAPLDGLFLDANGAGGSSVFGNGLFLDANGIVSRLASSGDPAPGGSTFTFFSAPAINSSGQVLFTAILATGGQGLFLASGGAITKIIAENDVFPDGNVFEVLQGPGSINEAGDVAFAGLSGGDGGDSGLFLFSGGTLNVVVPSFVPIASLGGVQLNPQSASINNAGQIVFLSQRIPQSGSGNSVFVFTGGSVTPIMFSGQSSPEGDVFSFVLDAQINNSGQVGFLSRLTQRNNGLYLFSANQSPGNQIARVAGQGDSIARQPSFSAPLAYGISNQRQALVFDQTFPGGNGLFSTPSQRRDSITLNAHLGQPVGNDGVIQSFFSDSFHMNGQGEVVMTARLSSGISAILTDSANGLTELVRKGDPAPGGGTFQSVFWCSISNLGLVAFSGQDSKARGIYLVANGQITLAVPSNTAVPGGGGNFGLVSLNSVNDQGDIAFLSQNGVTPNGIFLIANGQFTSIARDGDPAPGGGTFSLGFVDPRFGPAISNNGDVAFAADLSTGGRGVFLFSNGTVTRLAGPGDPSPDGSAFSSADAPSINSSGKVAFTGVTAAHGSGIFLVSRGTLVKKVAVPGGRILHHQRLNFADQAQINDLGDIAFRGDLSTGEAAVFIARPHGHE